MEAIMCNDDTEVEPIVLNNKQIFHAFLFNIRNYSPEVRNIQRRKDIEQRMIDRGNAI